MRSASGRPDLRPLGWAAATAVVSVVLLSAAVRWGWLGADVGRGREFCEAWRDGCIKQPVNTISNVGFVLAGLAIAWRSRVLTRRGSGPLRSVTVVTALACVVVLMGPASAAMHATGTELGGSLDLLSMHLIAGFALAYALSRVDSGSFWPLLVGLVVGAQVLSAVPGDVPVLRHPANVVFAAMLIAALVVEVKAWRRSPGQLDARWGCGGVGVLVVAFVIWNLAQGPWCDPHSWLQGHGVWHLLCAVSCWMLHRYYASDTGARTKVD